MKLFDVMNRRMLLVLTVIVTVAFLAGCGGRGGNGQGNTLPAAVRNLTATLGDLGVDLAWDAINGALSYNIYWSVEPGVTKLSAHYSTSGATYGVTGLEAGKTYYFRIAGVTLLGVGELSREVCLTLPPQIGVQGAWISPTPQGNTLNSVWAVSADSAYAVGSRGTIIHYTGAAWEVMPSPTTSALYGVWGTSDADVYAVGANGVILHWDGGAWSLTSIGSSSGSVNLGVWGLASNNVYVGGQAGVFHYNGAKWTKIEDGLPADLTVTGFWGLDAGNIYAYSNADGIWHFNGSGWTQAYQPDNGATRFTGMWGASADNIFAVATIPIGDGDMLFHYDGSSWSPVEVIEDMENMGLFGIWGSAADDIHVVAEKSNIYHYDGTEWSFVIGGAKPILYGVHGTASDNVFTVGEFGVIYRNDGDPEPDVTPFSRDETVYALNDPVWKFMRSMVVVDFYTAWNGGATAFFGGINLIYGYDGEDFLEQDLPDASVTYKFNSFWGQSENALFVVGGGYDEDLDQPAGRLLFNDGADWSAPVDGYEDQFWGVWGTSPTSLYLASGSGAVYHYTGNGSLEKMETPVDVSLAKIWGTSDSNIYAVGANGTIIHFDGVSWKLVDVGATGNLLSVWGSENDVYVAGESGTLLHYNGTAWVSVPTGLSSERFTDGWTRSADLVYIVGDAGRLFLYHPASGKVDSVESLSEFALNAVAPINGTDFYAVGYVGSVIRFAEQQL
ncbi:MAG: fibronectin type III domain-containing protein [Pseudomonadota bacterium]